ERRGSARPAPPGFGPLRLARAGDGRAHGLDPAARARRGRRVGGGGRAARRDGDRHRRDRPPRLGGARPRAAGGADQACRAEGSRLHPRPRRAGRAVERAAVRHRLFRPRHDDRRAGVAERQGARPRPREGHRGGLRQADQPRLPDRGAAALPHRQLGRRRAALPEAVEVRRAVLHRQLGRDLQCYAGAPARPR
ncbi:MAG: FIG00433945: hypothetical protein, partial [uncultured Craurococcus sp.]